jgi:hypothetical protein
VNIMAEKLIASVQDEMNNSRVRAAGCSARGRVSNAACVHRAVHGVSGEAERPYHKRKQRGCSPKLPNKNRPPPLFPSQRR